MFERWIEFPVSRSVLLLGPRRSGKTTLLKHRFPQAAYATLDDLDNLAWARQDPKGFVESLGSFAIIDEIQRHPPLTVAVKFALDEKGARFLMTGSSSAGLLDASADSLAGRIDIRHLPTACWGENDGEATHRLFGEPLPPTRLKRAARRLEDALSYGQFPEVLEASSPEEKLRILKNYRDTYFTRDLMMLTNIENLDGLMALYQHLGRSVGSLGETAAVARESGLSVPSAKKYLNSLAQSGLIFKLPGYQYGPAKRHIKAAKIYLADMGIPTAFGTRLSEGQRLENFVVAELEKRRKLGILETDRLYHYRSAAGREVDVIVDTGDSVIAIEIKAGSSPRGRDLRNLEDFAASMKRPFRCILLNTGLKYERVGRVEIVPVASLCGGA